MASAQALPSPQLQALIAGSAKGTSGRRGTCSVGPSACTTGLHNGRAKGAATAEEREEWWGKAMVLRDACRAVRAHDRDQLIEHIALWTRKIEELESSERG
ncbi:hypothetical protein [Streptomyces atratus]|uniref:hypothetical protein n=1 Tax=Streptomyces atratus TaxID=1893 RepID=UPI001E2D4B85|nr:hypothetical protein [Streptomyces atratus]